MKRRRDSNHTENTEEKTRSLKQAKTKSPVSFLRHRLFGPSRDQNEESSLKTREVTRDSVKSVPRPGREAIINSGDGEDNSAIVCYRGSAAYAVLRQLNREPHDGVVFSEDQDQTHSWLNQGWNIDLSQEVEPEREISSPLPLFHDSDDCQQQEVLPEIIRRNEVLPQEKPFKIGDYASVRQYNINVGSGTIVDTIHSSLFNVEPKVQLHVWRARSSKLLHVMSETPSKGRTKGSCSRKVIKTTFLESLSDELRIQKEMYPRTASSLPHVDFCALAKSIALDAFRKKRMKKQA